MRINPGEKLDLAVTDADENTRDLIDAARAGNRSAYEQLFATEMDWLLLYIDQRLGVALRKRVEPQDILQDTYLEAHKIFARFEYRGPRSFSHWLCRISETMIQRSVEFHSAQKRKVDQEARAQSSLFAQLATAQSSPATRAARIERMSQLAEALDKLTEQRRSVVLMRFFEGETVLKISERLAISPSTVKRELARALIEIGDLI